MDLTESEARTLFPDDRGDAVESATIEPWMSIERTDCGLVVRIDDERWTVEPHAESAVLADLSEELDREVVLWDLLVDVETTRHVLDRNT